MVLSGMVESKEEMTVAKASLKERLKKKKEELKQKKAELVALRKKKREYSKLVKTLLPGIWMHRDVKPADGAGKFL